MSDIVRTSGRPMTGALQDAIDNLPNRAVTIRALTMGSEDSTSTMAPLWRALALELSLAEVRTTDERIGLDRAWAADLGDSGPAWPQVEGNPAWFDPDTGEWTS